MVMWPVPPPGRSPDAFERRGGEIGLRAVAAADERGGGPCHRGEQQRAETGQKSRRDPRGRQIPGHPVERDIGRPRIDAETNDAALFDLCREAHLFDRAIDNQISRLRKKVEADNRSPRLIKTVWGGGYTLAARVRRLASPDTP